MPWSMNTRRPMVAPGWISMPVRKRPTCEMKRPSQRRATLCQHAVRPAMHHHRMQARITGQHLPGRAGGGVAFEDAGDVFAKALEHGGGTRWQPARGLEPRVGQFSGGSRPCRPQAYWPAARAPRRPYSSPPSAGACRRRGGSPSSPSPGRCRAGCGPLPSSAAARLKSWFSRGISFLRRDRVEVVQVDESARFQMRQQPWTARGVGQLRHRPCAAPPRSRPAPGASRRRSVGPPARG